MFHLSIRRPLLRYSHPTLRERRTVQCVLTHLPTGRRWVFNSRRAAMQAMAAMREAVEAGTMSILPAVPLDAEPVAVAA